MNPEDYKWHYCNHCGTPVAIHHQGITLCPEFTERNNHNDYKYNPTTGFVESFDSHNDESKTDIAWIRGYDTPFSLEWIESIPNGRLIATAPQMCELMEHIANNGLTLDDCIEIRKMLNYIYCEDLPHDKDGYIDWEKYPKDLLPDTRD